VKGFLVKGAYCMSYNKPNFTQAPNLLFDVHLREMGNAELRVVLVICRKTFGFHKDRDRISLSQLQKATGMSRQGVINGINQAVDRGLARKFTSPKGSEFELVVNEVDQQTDEVVNAVDQQVVNEVDTQKKAFKINILNKGRLAVFSEISGINPIKKDEKEWEKIDQEWEARGITEEDIPKMYKHVTEVWGFGVAGPGGITSAYNMMKTSAPKKTSGHRVAE
jgi:phage replication O-like protein O